MSSIIFCISLSIDALGIGITYGLRNIRTTMGAKLVTTVISVVFTASALFFGEIIWHIIPMQITEYLSSVLLTALGIYIVCSNLLKKPESFDADSSAYIDSKEALFLGIALSVDSFGAGIGYSCSGTSSYFIPFIVGFFQLTFLCTGIELGKRITVLRLLPDSTFSVLSGILLILIAVLRTVL